MSTISSMQFSYIQGINQMIASLVSMDQGYYIFVSTFMGLLKGRESLTHISFF